MDIVKGNFTTTIDASNLIFKDNSDQSNVVSQPISFDHTNNILKLPGRIQTNKNIIKNRTLIIKIDNDKYTTLNDENLELGNQDTLNLKCNVGETITFNLDRTENNGHSMIITEQNNNSVDNIANNNGNLIKYYLNNSEQTSYDDFKTNFDTNSGNHRSIVFTPHHQGTYYYKSSNDNNISGILSVKNDNTNNDEVNDDVSFNNNVDISINLSVDGKTTLKDVTTQDISVNGIMNVYGKTTVNSDMIVNGDISLNKNVDISNNLNLKGELTCEKNIYVSLDGSFNNNVYVDNTITTNNIPVINRSFTVKYNKNGNTFLINDISSYEFNPVIKVGESILFNQDDNTNVDTVNNTVNPLYISTNHNNDVVYEASLNNVIKYTVDNVEYSNIGDYETNLTLSTTRSVYFKAVTAGTYHYHNKNDSNASGRFTVIKSDFFKEDINKDINFNNMNIDYDLSTNFVPTNKKRIRIIQHPDY